MVQFMLGTLKKPSELILLKAMNKYRGKANPADIIYFKFQKHSERFLQGSSLS